MTNIERALKIEHLKGEILVLEKTIKYNEYLIKIFQKEIAELSDNTLKED